MVTRKQIEASLSADLVEYFRKQGMTLSEIADKIGVSESFMSRVARKKRCFTIEQLLAFEKTIGQPLPLLLLAAIPQESVSEELADLYQAASDVLSSALELRPLFDKQKHTCSEGSKQHCHQSPKPQHGLLKFINTTANELHKAAKLPIEEISVPNRGRRRCLSEDGFAPLAIEARDNGERVYEQPKRGCTEVMLFECSHMKQKCDGVVFIALCPHAKNAQVAGDFNNWQPEETPMQKVSDDGIWQLMLNLPTGRYHYQLVVDGQCQKEPSNEYVEPPSSGKHVPILGVKAKKKQHRYSHLNRRK